MLQSVGLLIISNAFMTFAWYGHLKNHKDSALWIVIVLSWSIAFFEYCFQVPANRIGSAHMTIGQLKVTQEIISMVIFSFFSFFYLKVPVTKNFLYASLCLVMAAFFIFKDKMN